MFKVLKIMLLLELLMLMLHNVYRRNYYASVQKRNHYASVKNHYAYTNYVT